MNRLPTLITYRSAAVMREEAIQFAYRKLGLYLGLPGASLGTAAGAWLTLAGTDSVLAMALFVVSLVSFALAMYCARTMRYPHNPRLSFEELNMMRDDMGLPAEVFQQTRDSVVLGSDEDWKSVKQAEAAVERIRRDAKANVCD